MTCHARSHENKPHGSTSMWVSSSTAIASKMSLKSSSTRCWRKHVTTGRQQPMSLHPPTLLIFYLRPDHDASACYHIDETLTIARLASRLIATHEVCVSLDSDA